MQDWKEDVRLHAVKFLWQIVLHTERSLTAKIADIFPVLCRCCHDTDRAVRTEAVAVANLLGHLLDYKCWIDYAVRQLVLSANIGVLTCFAEMFRDAPRSQKSNDVHRIAVLLNEPAFSHNLTGDYQLVVLGIMEQLVALYVADLSTQLDDIQLNDNGKSSTTKAIMYGICLKVIALAAGNPDVADCGTNVLEQLVDGKANVKEAHRQYLQGILERLQDLDAENSERAEPILLLHGIIALCGFQIEYLSAMVKAIETVMEHGTANARIKIFSGICVVRVIRGFRLTLRFTGYFDDFRPCPVGRRTFADRPTKVWWFCKNLSATSLNRALCGGPDEIRNRCEQWPCRHCAVPVKVHRTKQKCCFPSWPRYTLWHCLTTTVL